MRRVVPLLGVAVVTFWGWFADTDYRSAYGAFCAEGIGEDYRNCGYPTWRACQAAVSGVGGYCYANPQFRPEAAAPRRKRHPRFQ